MALFGHKIPNILKNPSVSSFTTHILLLVLTNLTLNHPKTTILETKKKNRRINIQALSQETLKGTQVRVQEKKQRNIQTWARNEEKEQKEKQKPLLGCSAMEAITTLFCCVSWKVELKTPPRVENSDDRKPWRPPFRASPSAPSSVVATADSSTVSVATSLVCF